MASIDGPLNDPLRLDLQRQTQKLLDSLPADSPYTAALKTASSRPLLLDALSKLLHIPQLTATVSTFFRPLLVDLCARWLEKDEDHLDKLEALCLLIEIHPELYPVLYALLRTSTLSKGPLSLLAPTQSPTGLEVLTLQRVLVAYYRILHANRVLPRTLRWSLRPLSQLIWVPYPDNGVRLLAIRCYAMQAGMAEGERVKMEKEALGEVSKVNCPITLGVDFHGSPQETDGWVFPVVELERIIRARNGLLESHEFYIDDTDSREPIHPAELNPLVANIHGILMLRSSANTTRSSPLIDTPTTAHSLRQIALHLSMQVPILLTSAPSSGKSSLISHLAQTLFPSSPNHIVTIHLADTSLDPRSLLGSYVSSPTHPGTFEWKEGVLVRAMREGKWVVLEDIDRATMEVLGIIKPLVETRGADKWIGGRAHINVPSRGVVEAEESFALFATRSLQPSRKGTFASPTFFGSHKFYEVAVESPTASDLQIIVETKFPRLTGPSANGIINLWEGIRALGAPSSARDVGLRELEQFCARVSGHLPSNFRGMDIDEDTKNLAGLAEMFPNPTLREDIFLEARDVFFGAGATTASVHAHLNAVAEVVGEHLGISDERMRWLLTGRTPDVEIEKDINGKVTAIRAGRTRLPARPFNDNISAQPASRPFAMHRPAASLITRLATAIALAEPVLLTGETGTGKTSVVTHLAAVLHRPLISLNLSNQTESSDILGGFKPVDARVPGGELQERFLELFGGTFSRKKNAHFEESVRKAVQERKWKRAVGLWLEAVKMAKDRIKAKQVEEEMKELQEGAPRKRRKVEGRGLNVSLETWQTFESDVQTFEVQHIRGKSKFAFAFVEGPLVKALRNGDWILLDEVNLATPETLESIAGLLHGPTASITLTEQGSLEPIPRHSEFRLFACMNPATDVGKKDLPPHLRSRFTEIDVPPPDADKETLLTIVSQYIGACAVGDRGAIMDVAEFYTAVKSLAQDRQIADGANHRPHFSMRTLARALTFASDMARSYSLRRALWEGCLMAFTMALDGPSAAAVTVLAQKHILAGVRNPRSLLTKEPLPPSDSSAFIKFGPFYLERGPLPEDPVEHYIMTPSVETKLVDLARIIVAKRFPVLIEGPTSSGKTSSIEYLAKRTGHRFVRINNHEHTDIQEYIGTYVSDPLTGKLVFKEGLLVRALRQGDWIVLDELNLAPTDVLEALNRLLDDNRELVIPETQEVVRPHPHFMLFATQNPPGLYAGRKVLSRAFRNRFLEVHFEDVPQSELETILCQRCQIAPSYGQRIVSVFRELQKHRQTGRVFESKQGFATLRDLFRWAGRDAVGYEELAANGYMLLAERARREDDKAVVKEVIESVMKVRINESSLYNLVDSKFEPSAFLGCPFPSSSQVVWTAAMQRLFILTARALRFNEPVLLVGETGCGKTSVCQLYAEALQRMLRTVNCHQNTETADLIGGLRPVRNKALVEAETVREVTDYLIQLGVPDIPEDATTLTATIDKLMKSSSLTPEQLHTLRASHSRLQRLPALFEWRDGPLVEAMRNGDVFLLDEISLADDSVLERLNSVLETGRTIVLAERGGDDTEIPAIQASAKFKLIATMNPGGDYGKKELSPALRNRFTEIWVPSITDRQDLECIVQTLWDHDALRPFTQPLLNFVEWTSSTVADRSFTNLRDILAWVSFSNATSLEAASTSITPSEIFHHAAQMTILDGLGSMPQLSAYSRDALHKLKLRATEKLYELAPVPSSLPTDWVVSYDDTRVKFGIFTIARGPQKVVHQSFSLEAPTTQDNVMRVIRACQLPKPIMLEGSPGVGKTSLVAALAGLCGHSLCRINLSDQTDLVDLFGSDLPVEGGEPGQFAWKDAEFLRALQEGHWVLLDEMNLAPQSVLEGLNAVLDHRGTVYIPELGRSFVRHPSFRIFAAQNPLHQGGGRKGLPKSFLNRFTKVYVQEMSPNDLLLICRSLFPDYPVDLLEKMIAYMSLLNEETMIKRSFGREGAPWEFNLRDVIRWATLLRDSRSHTHPSKVLSPVILQRFRTAEDRKRAYHLFTNVFSDEKHVEPPAVSVSPDFFEIGYYGAVRSAQLPSPRSGRILQASLPALESLMMCIENGWLAILTGPRNSGKTTLIKTFAGFMGKTLHEVSINTATDATDILGSFEETDLESCVSDVVHKVRHLLEDLSCSTVGSTRLANYDHMATLQALPPVNSASALASTSAALLHLLDALQDIPEPYHSRRVQIKIDIQQMSLKRPQAAQLEWIDGPLVRALKEGQWLLLDGANLCNPSVLDRLNSLCELGGSLTLNERGAVNGEVQTLKPHSDFRLFMCVDSQYGELSRAMRNRGVEIALTAAWNEEDTLRVLDHVRCPPALVIDADVRHLTAQATLQQRGLCAGAVASDVHLPSSQLLLQDSSNSHVIDILNILRSETGKLSRGSSYFVASQAVPLFLSHLSRFISLPSTTFVVPIRALLGELACSHLYRCIVQMRMNISQSLHIPRDASLAQPLYTTPLRVDHEKNPLELEILRYLRLFAATTVDYGGPLEDDSCQRNVLNNDRARIQDRATTQAKTLAEVIRNAATLFLGEVAPDVTRYDHTDNMLEIVHLGRFLRSSIASSPAFDFSLVFEIIQRLQHALRVSSGAELYFAGIGDSLKALENIVSLSSGKGLIDLWKTFSGPVPGKIGRDKISALVKASSCLTHSPIDFKLRIQMSDVISMWALQSPEDEPLQTLKDVTVELEKRIPDHSLVGDGSQQNCDPAYLQARLRVLSMVATSSAQLEKGLRELVEYGHSHPDLSLQSLLVYRRLLWALEARQPMIGLSFEAHAGWLSDLWNVVPMAGLDGPSALCHPIELTGTILLCDESRRPMNHLDDYELQLKRRLTFISSSLVDSTSRLTQMSEVLIDTTFSIASSLGDASPRIPLVLDALDELGSTSFSEMYRTTLRSSLRELSQTRSYAMLGRCWVNLSRLLLQLYVPNLPLDPEAVQKCSYRYTSEKRKLLEEELSLQLEYERRTLGRRDNTITRYLSAMLSTLGGDVSQESAVTTLRGDVVQLHSYWTEISQFLEQVISPQKIDVLFSALETRDPSAPMREQLIQESTAAFCRRLENVYHQYEDVNRPIHLALLQLRLGLRLFADAAAFHDASHQYEEIITALISFPSCLGLNIAQGLEVQQPGSFPLALWRLSTTATGITSGADIEFFIPLVASIYEQSFGIWLVDKARKEEVERQEQSLYRHKTEMNDAPTDAELEERDFLSLFPEYGDLLDAEPPTSATTSTPKPKTLIQPIHVQQLSSLHLKLFGAVGQSSGVSETDFPRRILHDMLTEHASVLPETLDGLSRPYQIIATLERLSALHGRPRDANKLYNFYLDPNVLEIRKSSSVLEGMTARLDVLIHEWPDQMVLQHLKTRCDAVLALDVLSPVAKVLSAIEQLLLQMEDWEMYANKENTLKSWQHDLASLVVSWRRLELTSWQGLLRAQAQEFANGASEWWFQLYEALVRGVSTAANEDASGVEGALVVYLRGLIPLLDSFMMSSPLGQFSIRLRLLQAFESYSVQVSTVQSRVQAAASRRTHRILHFTRRYYSQFAAKVSASLSTQQQTLEKEIRDFIKLASWKDINVHALKQSAQRTHRQLYKCVRKFRDILRQPVTPHIIPASAGSEESTSIAEVPALNLPFESPVLPPFPTTQSLPEHLRRLGRTFEKLQSVVNSRLGVVINSLSSTQVEELSADIISAAQSLASASPPASATKEQRDKFNKALLVRKRKSWSDLLKELKRVGLAVNMRPEVLAQQSDSRWIREQPIAKHIQGSFEKSETYFLRLTKLLPDLRAALASHHDDVGLRDLQRGTNLVESAFSLAIESRVCFVEAASHGQEIEAAIDRLKMMHHHPRVVFSGSETYGWFISLQKDLGHLGHAMHEIAVALELYLQEFPDTAALPEVFAEIKSALTSTQAFFGPLADVTQAVKSLRTRVLLDSEAAIIQRTQDHVHAVKQLLVRWAEGPNVVAHFVKPVLRWLEQSSLFSLRQFAHTPQNNTADSGPQLIDQILLCVQGMLALHPTDLGIDTDISEMPEHFIRDTTRLMLRTTNVLKLLDVGTLLATVADEAIRTPSVELAERLARTMPFLDAYMTVVRTQLARHCAWTKALFKLDYVVCSVVSNVARNGFCKPPDPGDGEAGEAGTQDAGGIGLGEGSGSENVSKDIEDESQVEGLQGEADADEDVERAEEGDALEMSEDFGGKMQDVPEKEEGEGEDNDDDEEDENEPEERVEDIDAGDPSAVDEKLWGDETGPEESKQDNGKTEDHSTKQSEKESEMTAKEEAEDKSQGREKPQPKEQGGANDEVREEEGEEPVQEGVEDEDPMDEADEQRGGAPIDDFVPEANALDLPDDMEFDKDGGKGAEVDDDIEMSDEGGEDDETQEEERPADEKVEDAEEDMDVDPGNQQVIPDDQSQAEGGPEDTMEGATAQPDLHAGTGQDSGEAGDQAMTDASGEGGQGPSKPGDAGAAEESEEREQRSQDESVSEGQLGEQSLEKALQATENEGAGSAQGQQGSAPSMSKLQPLQSNPLKSLGDALREIRQRMNDILENDGPQSRQEQQAAAMQASQLEYLRPEEDTGAEEMQALGPAHHEDTVKLDELKYLDETMEDPDAPPLAEDHSDAAEKGPLPQPSSSALHDDATSQSLDADIKSALTRADIRSSQPAAGTAEADLLHAVPAASNDPEIASQEAVELVLRQWQSEGQPEIGAEDMWRKYETLTHDVSYALCEQLRLILEPTMATRLRGDYRTGKRLNMKKIIPYIASEFTKDKIWLRRTRPSQREYQVLIALDDSRSMAESHSVHLAFQTLALVAHALGKLEVGDVAVARFGETVDVLHGFDGGPFTQQAGAKVMSAFRFDQRATQVLSLVETSLGMLAQARERRGTRSGSAADLWQLEIIISDGICQDHDALRAALRRAEEQRVMVVFVILDSLHSKGVGSGGQNESSILSMSKPTIKMVGSRAEVEMARYLDTFPFEYYVVLRNVEALPDVLAGTLKQFFERIAEA